MDAPDETRDFARRLRKNATLPERLLWRALKVNEAGLRFRRQHPIGPYVLDFFCVSTALAVEVDGASHAFGDRPAKDERRDAWLAAKGIRMLRLAAPDVLADPDGCVRGIVAAAKGEV